MVELCFFKAYKHSEMLRKHHAIKGKNVVGGKELKLFRERCLALFKLDEDSLAGSRWDDDTADAIVTAFFPKKVQCLLYKWQYTNPHTYTLVYCMNDVPVCVEMSNARDYDSATQESLAKGCEVDCAVPTLVPTVFGLLRLRQVVLQHREAFRSLVEEEGGDCGSSGASCSSDIVLLEVFRRVAPIVWINQQTTSFLISGAHLMAPGVVAVDSRSSPSSHPYVKSGEVVLVCARDASVPCAVGLCTPNFARVARQTSCLIQELRPAAGRLPPRTVAAVQRSGSSLEGIAVVVLTCVGDLLWGEHLQLFVVASSVTCKVSKDSSAIMPKTFSSAVAAGSIECDASGSFALLHTAAVSDEGTVQADEEGVRSGDAETSVVETEELEGPAVNEITDDNNPSEDEAEEDDVFDPWVSFPSVDAMLLFAFCSAVRRIKQGQLPLPLNTFVSDLSRCYPRGLPTAERPEAAVPPLSSSTWEARVRLAAGPIDWKQTPYKKALTYITTVGKDTLTLKEQSTGVFVITKFHKSSDVLRNFKKTFGEFLLRVHLPALELEEAAAAAECCAGKGGAAAASMRILSESAIASIEVVYRPQNGMHPAVEQLLIRGRLPPASVGLGDAIEAADSDTPADGVASEDSDGDEGDSVLGDFPVRVVTHKTLRDNLRKYVASRQLLTTSGGAVPTVTIDLFLRQLWPGSTKDFPESLSIVDLDAVVLHKFCPMHILRYSDNTVKLRNGKPPTVHVYSEKRSGNKTVTIVRNLEAFGFHLEAIASSWKAQFATSVSVVNPAEKESLKLKSGTKVPLEIHMQGPFVSQLETHLSTRMGVPRSLIVSKK